MEEVRYSKRIRAARDAAAAEKSEKKSDRFSKPVSLPPGNLFLENVDRPAYHPRFGTVMSSEQQELLKRQITVYATICQQLVELHKSSVAAAVQDLNGNGGGKREPTTVVKTGMPRHRWSPSQNQLEVLESFYNSSSGATPNKQKVREIAAQLSLQGSITETNVYNWFQNRKARFRRMKSQQPEGDTEKTKPVSPVGDTDVSGSNHVSFKLELSKAADNEEQQLTQVYINGDLSEVPSGVFSVRDRFGEGALLVNEQGEGVLVDESGRILQPLLGGGKYILSQADVSTAVLPDGGDSSVTVFAKLPSLNEDQTSEANSEPVKFAF